MRFLAIVFRGLVSLGIGLATALVVAVLFFDFAGQSSIDRIFLVAAPAFALAALLYLILPTVWREFKQRRISVTIYMAIVGLVVATVVILPTPRSTIYLLAFPVTALIAFGFMLPTARSLQYLIDHAMQWRALAGYLLGGAAAYLAVAFLDNIYYSTLSILVIIAVFSVLGSLIGFYLVTRMMQSLRNGFLSSALNLLLSGSVVLFFAGILYLCVQFPDIFNVSLLVVSNAALPTFLVTVLVTGAWVGWLLAEIDRRNYFAAFQNMPTFRFVRENLPGFYAAAVFFMIYFLLANVFNRPSFSLNSKLFEADAGPWLSILGVPGGHPVNRSVHPLVLITLRPIARLLALFLSDKWYFAPMLLIAATGGLCVLLAWFFLRRATGNDTYAFVYASILGASAAHLHFASVTETYIFSAAALILFFVLIQKGERPLSALVPAGVLIFGITITNFIQSIIGLFFIKTNYKKIFLFVFWVLVIAIALTVVNNLIYPNSQMFFFVPSGLLYENRFTFSIFQEETPRIFERISILAKSIAFHNIIGPEPILNVVGKKAGHPMVKFSTADYSHQQFSQYVGFSIVPFYFWTIWLVLAFVLFIRGFRNSKHRSLELAFLACLAFNFLLHVGYGTELFLYTPDWTYALVFFVALAMADLANRKWAQIVLMFFLWLLMFNNAGFLYQIMSGLVPYIS